MQTQRSAGGTADGAWDGLEALRPDLSTYLHRRVRNRSDVDDLVQETLIRAARYRQSLSDASRLRPWLMRIASNVLADRARSDRRSDRSGVEEELFGHLESREPSMAEEEEVLLRCGDRWIDQEEALAHMRRALDELGEGDRRVLSSYYHQGRACREVAERCQITHGLVKVRLFRARRRLARAVEGRVRRMYGPRTVQAECV